MLIDGNSVLNRAFYGLKGPKMLSTSDGFYTNAIYGFLNILLRFLNDEKPTHLVVTFDMKSPTFRHEQFDGYKANRKGMPDELAAQMPILKEILDAMNIKRIEIKGYEADDIIGTLAKAAEREDYYVVIVTGDRDALQLVSDKVKIKMPVTRSGKTEVDEYDREIVVEKYGVTPGQIIDVKGLMGDASDNIPGVRGIGEKTAFELIQKFESIENIYSNIEILDIKDRIKNLLKENKELAGLSKRLATIDINAPASMEICDCEIKEYNVPMLLPILKKLEFNSIISKLGIDDIQQKEKREIDINSKYLTNEKEIEELISTLEKSKKFAYYLLINKKHRLESEIVGISFCWNENSTVYIHLKEKPEYLEYLKKILTNIRLQKYTFDAKPHYELLEQFDVVDFDVMIAAYLIDPAKELYSLAKLSHEYLDLEIADEKELFTYEKSDYSNCDIENVSRIACEQAAAVFKLTEFMKDKLEQDEQNILYYEVELPLTKVLADMEMQGIKVDCEELDRISSELEIKIDKLTKEIIEMAGETFNINSTKQLGLILFEKLKLPVIRKTKTGYSTDVEVLEALSTKHPIIVMLLEYRQLVKLKSTYIDGLKSMINPVTGRIHSNFNQTVTVTGRISSTEPNLQNIPIKIEMGKCIRKLFVAQDGYILVDADYSQIELRVLAHIANDENMIDAFKRGDDIHRITASQVFKVSENEVTSLMRSRAKTINFGIVYGIGDFSLAKDLKITKKQAKDYINSYLEKYNGVRTYMQKTIELGKEKGYVNTLLGRRRYLPEINSKNFNIRSFGERVAMNTPIQGTAADIIKVAMVKVNKELNNRKLQSKLILQVHDELIIETKIQELEEVKSILKSCMENAMEMAIPLEADVHWGKSWYDAK